jgi:para-nitrobenzyl esterase
MSISPSDPSLCKTRDGLVRGSIVSPRVMCWKNIPYAQAERFKPPINPSPWNNVLVAKEQGHVCPQRTSTIEDIFANSKDKSAGAERARLFQSEDCLNLNIYTPDYRRLLQSSSTGVPVLVWLYGGAFKTGSNGVPLYDATQLCERWNVIVVVPNYRVNVFGFLASKELLQDSGANFGLLDQKMAFEWVRANIADFGGDGANVTAFGESAGAISVHYHMLYSKGLFDRAILQSGSIGTIPPLSVQKHQRIFDALCKEFDVEHASPQDKLAKLRSVPERHLLEAATRGSSSGPDAGNEWDWSPCIDGVFIHNGDYRTMEMRGQGDEGVKQVILGITDDEGSLFAMGYRMGEANVQSAIWKQFLSKSWPTGAQTIHKTYSTDSDVYEKASLYLHDASFAEPVRFTANCLVKKGTSTYVYRFSQSWHISAPAGLGVHHASEIPFVFFREVFLQEDEKRVAIAMVKHWSDFAKDGFETNDEWKQYPLGVMQFGPMPQVAKFVDVAALKGWDRDGLLDMMQVRAIERSASHLSKL